MNQNPSRKPLLLTAMLLLVALAGCTDQGSGDGDATAAASPGLPRAADGRDLTTQLQASDEIPGPTWTVGDWWGHHVYFGTDDDEGVHYNAIVVAGSGDAWQLASDDAEAAAMEALWDIPILGDFSKSDLATTSGGEAWLWYDFPLADGKTWTSTMDLRGEGPEELTSTATYDPAIASPAGTFPGFLVETRLADGALALQYDYVPAIGWYSQFKAFDLSTDEPDDVELRAVGMGFGHGWTGTYYVTEAVQLAQNLGYTIIAPPAVMAAPDPFETFTVSDEATHVFGYGFAYSYAGAQALALRDPNGDHWEAVATPLEEGASFFFDRVPAVAGDWYLANVGAGMFSVAGLFLWELTETTGEL